MNPEYLVEIDGEQSSPNGHDTFRWTRLGGDGLPEDIIDYPLEDFKGLIAIESLCEQ